MTCARRTLGLARAVFALLVLATAAASFVTQRLKHSPTVVQNVRAYPSLSPDSRNPGKSAKLSFRIKRADEVTVTMVDPKGEDIATLVRDHHLAAYTQYGLRWNGRTDAGRIAPDGAYQIRVRLRNQGRSVLLAKSIVIHTARPITTLPVGPDAEQVSA